MNASTSRRGRWAGPIAAVPTVALIALSEIARQVDDRVQHDVGQRRQRLARAGARQHADRETCAAGLRHLQVVPVVADHRDLRRLQPGQVAEGDGSCRAPASGWRPRRSHRRRRTSARCRAPAASSPRRRSNRWSRRPAGSLRDAGWRWRPGCPAAAPTAARPAPP